MAAARALPEFRGDSSVRSWLLSIARRICIDELRRRSRQARRNQQLADLGRSATNHQPPAANVEIRDLITRLDPDRRAAFALTQLLGLSYAEAAQVCDCPVGTIRSRVARAREDLITLLQRTSELQASSRS